MLSPVTDLSRYRAARRRPACDLLSIHAALVEITIANLRAAAALQRTMLREFWRL